MGVTSSPRACFTHSAVVCLLSQVDIQSTRRHPETPVNIAGFHFPSKAEQASVFQKPVETVTRSDEDPAETSDTAGEFSSFLFWRDPPLAFNSELLGLLVSCTNRSVLLQTGTDRLR